MSIIVLTYHAQATSFTRIALSTLGNAGLFFAKTGHWLDQGYSPMT